MDNLVHIKDKLIAMVLGLSRSSTILRDIHSVWLVWFVICLFVARILYVVVMKQIAELKVPVQLLIIFLYFDGRNCYRKEIRISSMEP